MPRAFSPVPTEGQTWSMRGSDSAGPLKSEHRQNTDPQTPSTATQTQRSPGVKEKPHKAFSLASPCSLGQVTFHPASSVTPCTVGRLH